jgi:hypothetical protein
MLSLLHSGMLGLTRVSKLFKKPSNKRGTPKHIPKEQKMLKGGQEFRQRNM